MKKVKHGREVRRIALSRRDIVWRARASAGSIPIKRIDIVRFAAMDRLMARLRPRVDALPGAAPTAAISQQRGAIRPRAAGEWGAGRVRQTPPDRELPPG